MPAEKGPKKKDTDPLRIAVPARLREYLMFLTRKTTLGASANAVALSVLTQELERMRATPQYAYEFPEVPIGEDEDGDRDVPAAP
jgi:hypothetical protein